MKRGYLVDYKYIQHTNQVATNQIYLSPTIADLLCGSILHLGGANQVKRKKMIKKIQVFEEEKVKHNP